MTENSLVLAWRRSRLKTLQLVLNCIAKVAVLEGHRQHLGEENAEQFRCFPVHSPASGYVRCKDISL